MKKIFALLLSIWIPVYLMFGLLASCEKSNEGEVSSISKSKTITVESTAEVEKQQVAGNWQLVEFYQDLGNGEGSWGPAQNPEQVNFSENGDFTSNEYFPQHNMQFNKYRFIDSIHIELYSTQSAETARFYFKRESTTSLLFNPVCRENCSRRYSLVQ